MRERIDQLLANLSKTIVGKQDAIRLVLVALFSGGHALLEDVPGVGKTLIAKSLARSISGQFQRLQCTPDLLPSDVTGINIWNQGNREFEFLPGPVFSNVLLADEINRATPRTQSALLEVMEEHQVTVDGRARLVPQPFFVIATQNPIEYQGTFPLPEAQMDRFMISLSLGYPTDEEELLMLQRQRDGLTPETLDPSISLTDIIDIRQQVKQVSIKDELQRYLLNLVRASRNDEEISLGVSPRGAVALQKAAQSYAFISGRDYVEPDDIKYLAPHVLAHRLIPAGGKQAKPIIQKLLQQVPVEPVVAA
ncbi:MAG: MoxR family ATPase [Cyanobacteria bacterium P01_H01_bin.15]